MKKKTKLFIAKCHQNIKLTSFAILLPQIKILGDQSPSSWLSYKEKVMFLICATLLLVLFRLDSCNFQVAGAPSPLHLPQITVSYCQLSLDT